MLIAGRPASPVEMPPAIHPKLVILGVPLGLPQYVAGALLLLFLAQGLWLVSRRPLTEMELSYVRLGQAQLHGQGVADGGRSALIAILAAAPVHRDYSPEQAGPAGIEPPPMIDYAPAWRWLVRLPFLIVGVLLGSSVWYVARRLYGNAGGYVALTLYAFSPAMLTRAASVQPGIVGAWGCFGAVFTGIAVAHTLYAPREVVLWNWRRILLLGLSFGLAAGSRFSLLIVVPLALLFMLYLAPERRRAALAIFVASCAVGLLVLWGAWGFHFTPLLSGIRHAGLLDFTFAPFTHRITYILLAQFLLAMPALFVLLLAAIATYALWQRARFFGTTAPLLMFLLLMALGIIMPRQGGYNFFVAALPFAFVFVAGVFADLLETTYGGLVVGIVAGVLLGHAVFSLAPLLAIR